MARVVANEASFRLAIEDVRPAERGKKTLL
jgi:hypothetical protein